MKEFLKNHTWGIGGVAILLVVVFLVPLPKFIEYDFYDFHVAEAEAAHARGLSFNVWSGISYEPRDEDFDIPWVIHPDEDPRTEIPHGSNLGTGKTGVVFGLYGLFTTPWYSNNIEELKDEGVVYFYD